MLTLEQMTPEQKLGRILCCRRLGEQDNIDFTLEQYCAAKPEHPIPVPDNANEIIAMTAKDCITADCDEGVSPAIDPGKKRLFVVVVPQDHSDGDVSEEVAVTAPPQCQPHHPCHPGALPQKALWLQCLRLSAPCH